MDKIDTSKLMDISIHALYEEGYKVYCHNIYFAFHFNPRPLRGGRLSGFGFTISHARFQSTPSTRRATRNSDIRIPVITNFNPRPLRGGRPIHLVTSTFSPIFQSTPSTRRATTCLSFFSFVVIFQSTPSTRRATLHQRLNKPVFQNFNPRPLRGGRLR